METKPEVVPLPEHLKECGCPQAQHGRHLTSCIPAREYDKSPLTERPDFEMGRRYQAISWQYPMRMSCSINVTVELDPIAYIKENLAAYDAFVLDSGYEAWEKPMVFLTEKLTEDSEQIGMAFGWSRHIASVSSFVDDVEESPRWTVDKTAELEGELEPHRVKIDPNQETLGL